MSETAVSKAALRGMASGVLLMTFFGTMWAGIGIGGLQGWGNPWLPIFAIVICIVLFVCGYILSRSSQKLPSYSSKSGKQRSKRTGMWFNIIFGLEFILIVFAAVICGSINHFEYFFPVMAIIVGVHFLPLAYLFKVSAYYITGALLCFLAIVTMLFVPVNIEFLNHEISAWWSFIGFGSALILWVTSVIILLNGRKMLRLANNA
ncbi:hypothetical protein J14TS2_30040 [Bacillus sp. J14TS2]|uniref:hypothetical protein n=1 Tax=Bacillus sp. J14TS2 TaxID=2807188 RepID=UPI001AFE89DB|nr:hypothetical protein [Bacillus sp. J14TS2]GIN72529.1 hypothetical protein J14TS2_30040 [Bacillus sp. J14TS2]